MDAPSSKAVEEAGHFERIVRLGMVDWQKRKTFEIQGKGGKRGVKALRAQVSSLATSDQFGFFGNFGVIGNFGFLCFLFSSVFQRFWAIQPLPQTLQSQSFLLFLSEQRCGSHPVWESHKGT